MTINIEITEKPDLEALAAIHGSCFPKGWRAGDFQSMLAVKGTMAFVAEGAFSLLRVVADEAEILTLAVSEPYRRKGMAAALVKQMVYFAAMHDAGAVFLEVGEDNKPARRLYISAGFMAVSRRPRYYTRPDGTEEAAIVMRYNTV